MPSPDQAITARPTRFSADELIPFGKYMLLNKIQSGATAAVYRAKIRGEAGFERLVAIKRILPQMAGDPEFVRTFVEEAKTCARLTHENICPIYELGKVGESLYIAMEWLPGKDLGAITRRLSRQGEVMPPLIAAWIASRLCDALDYAHSLKIGGGQVGIIHRDLSPTNIVISYEGQVKLIDFGLAKASGRAQQTNVDALKQKLGYMSPELVLGRAPDARSDVFGVGVCLYEMITARRLFAGKDDVSTLRMVSNASVPPPSALVEDAPEELEMITMRALERAPEDRWQTAGEMGKHLTDFIAATDPMYGSRQVAEFMHKLFASDMEAEQARVNELLKASHDPQVLEERKRFFASPAGAAAIAKAEAARRLSTLPPPVRPGYEATLGSDPVPPLSGRIPKPARLPRIVPEPTLAQPPSSPAPRVASAPAGSFEDEPTNYRDRDGIPDLSVPDPEYEPTRAYDPDGGDEPTHFLPPEEKTTYLTAEALEEAQVDAGTDGAIEAAATAEPTANDSPPADGAAGSGRLPGLPLMAAAEDEEELTHIFFNLEEGIGVPELVNVPAEPQSAPETPPALLTNQVTLSAPEPAARSTSLASQASYAAEGEVEARSQPGRRRTPSSIRAKALGSPLASPGADNPNWMRGPTTTGRRQSDPDARRPTRSDQLSTALLVVGIIMLVLALVGLVTKTPVGVKLGLRKPSVASIEVRTSPPVNAAVKLDGIYRGRAPLRLEGVHSGRRTIAVEADGYQSVARQIELAGGSRAQLMIDLEPAPR